MKVRYWDYERNTWAYGVSIWDGKALPYDNSGWRQQYDGRYGVLYQRRETGGYLTQAEMRAAKNVQPADIGVWARSAVLSEHAPSVVKCACGRRMTIAETRNKFRRCLRCRETNRALRKPNGRAA